MKEEIIIETINPFEHWFPQRKLVNRDTLNLIKVLREEGYIIKVKPDNERPIEYLYRKGIRDVFADPLYIAFINMGMAVVGTLIANAIQKVIDRKPGMKSNSEQTIIINVQNNYYTSKGEQILEGYVKDKKKKDKVIQKQFKECLSSQSPYSHLPIPILIEHKPKIVGWCSLALLPKQLVIKDAIILDKKVKKKIMEGKLKGASITGLTITSKCSICNSNYIDCNHIAGKYYDGIECVNIILESIPIELSLVKEPINPECIIQLKEF